MCLPLPPPCRRRRGALRVALVLLLTPAAWARPAAGCDHLRLVLDPRLTPEILQRDWATGAAHDEPDAVLELRGCRDELLDRLELAAPLAMLDPTRLRGTPEPTWLVTADVTAPAGSTSGPLTVPVEAVSHRLRVARARGPAGGVAPIQLAATGKAAWHKVAAGRSDELLAVGSRATRDGFETSYRRYRVDAHGWTYQERREPGLWESDADFPDASQFP